MVGGIWLLPLLNGCSPAPIYALRSLVRSAQSGQNGNTPHFGSSKMVDSDFKNSTYPSYVAQMKSLPWPTPSSSQNAQLAEFQNRSAQWASLTLSGAAKPVQNGNGLVIGEPTSSTRNGALANFGGGCARWLHFNVSGQGALGKTPLWGNVADVRDELRKTDCRWTSADLPQLARGTGATHIALGDLAGTPTNAVLSYQLWNAQTRQKVGGALVVKGTRAQIVAQLPRMAQQLSALVILNSSSSTRLAGKVELNEDELQFLGSVPWKATDALLPEQETRLRVLSKKSALAGVLWIYNSARDGDEKNLWRDVTSSVARLAPQNTLAIATLSLRVNNYFRPYLGLLTTAQKKFPNNYALLTSQWWWQTKKIGAASSRAVAYKAISASPKNALAWRDLSETFADEADEIRNGKYASQMTASESSQVSALYPMQTMAGLQSARVDPLSDGAWLQVSQGAAFDGEAELADIAYWKALALGPKERDNYWWGLQLYQPKWQGDATKLHQIAFLLSRNPVLYAHMMDDIFWAFKESDGSDILVHSMAIDAINALQAAAKKQPRQVAYHRELCEMLRKKSRLAEAVNEYSIWIRLQPDSTVPLTNLGRLYFNTLHDNVNAEKMFSAALKLQPNDGAILVELANFDKDTLRDFTKAAPLYQRVIKAEPQSDEALCGLANCYWFLKNDEKTGGALFVKATKIAFNNGYANAEYAWALLKHGHRDQAKTEAQKSLDLGFSDHPVFKELGMASE